VSVDAEQATIIGIGVASLLVIGPAIFKAANVKGDTNNKWSTRVDLALVALDDKIVRELGELRNETDHLLAPVDAPFDPAQAIVDPSPLSARVERTALCYAARVRMRTDLDRARRLGRVFVVSLSMLAVAVVLLTLFYAELVTWDPLRWAGVVVGGIGLIALIAATVVYVVCMDHLSDDEILADTASQARDSQSR
jgi:anti-sigma-K factor RskA